MRDGGFAVYVALFTEFPPRAGTLTTEWTLIAGEESVA
jgi:hypothetical protein